MRSGMDACAAVLVLTQRVAQGCTVRDVPGNVKKGTTSNCWQQIHVCMPNHLQLVHQQLKLHMPA